MKTNRIKTVLFCLWVIAAMLLVQAGAAVVGLLPRVVKVVSEVGADPEAISARLSEFTGDASIMTTVMFIAEIVSVIVAGIWYYMGYVRKNKAEKASGNAGIKFGGIKSIAFTLCGCVAAWSLAVIVSQIISSIIPQTAQDVGESLELALGGNVYLGIISAVVLAPIFEELTVRGIILQRSKRAFGVIGCIIISAILFGVFHLNIIQGLYVLPMGLFWGFVGYRFNSVIPCIICHMLNNFLGVMIPAAVNPVILFIVSGAVTAFAGVKFGYFTFEKEAENV